MLLKSRNVSIDVKKIHIESNKEELPIYSLST